MNASRIPGFYVYPVREYNTQPVEAVEATRPRAPEAARSAAIAAGAPLRDALEFLRETKDQQADETARSRYQERAFTRTNSGAQTGLFLNLLG